jgi:hypothetical protein
MGEAKRRKEILGDKYGQEQPILPLATDYQKTVCGVYEMDNPGHLVCDRSSNFVLDYTAVCGSWSRVVGTCGLRVNFPYSFEIFSVSQVVRWLG